MQRPTYKLTTPKRGTVVKGDYMKQVQVEEDQHREEWNIYRLLRVAYGLSINETAQRLGVSSAHVSSIEKGRKMPSEELKQKYADIFLVKKNFLETYEFPSDKSKPDFIPRAMLTVLSAILTK